MRRLPAVLRRAALAGVLAACAVAAPAPAAPLDSVATDTVDPRAAFVTQPLRDLAEAAEVPGLVDAVDAWLQGRPNEAERLEWSTRQFVADWSGDGRPDDLSIHYTFEIRESAVRTTTTARAVEGDSGNLLWTRRWAKDSDTFVFPVEAMVGKPARPGVILVEVEGFMLDSTAIDYTFRALTGRGKKVWVRKHESTIVGSWPVTFVGTDYLVTAAPFDGLPGAATDFLIASGSVVQPPAYALRSGVIDAAVIDGRDGSVVQHPLPVVGAGFVPFAAPVSDLDLDGLDDYVFANAQPSVGPAEDGETLPVATGTGVVTSRKGTDGFPLWTTGGLDFQGKNVGISHQGDVVRGKEGDVFVETHEQLLQEDNPDQYQSYLIDGAGGVLVWKRRGQSPYSPGDIDGDGSGDFLLQSYYSGEGYVETHVRAFTDNGGRLWDRKYRTEHPLQTCCSWRIGGGWSVGDLDGDGLADAYLDHSAGPIIQKRHDVDVVEHLVIDAASGRVLVRGGKDLEPLGRPAVDGGYSDYALVSWELGGIRVETHDGTSGALLTSSLVTFDVPLDPKNVWFFTSAARLDRDRCADVALTVEAPSGVYEVMIDGSDGTLLWSDAIGRREGTARVSASTDSNEAC